MKLLKSAVLAICLTQPVISFAQAKSTDAFVCAKMPSPVITLDHGSRYIAKDDSRSKFDTESNADVNAQLAPVDDFISALSQAANHALTSDEDQQLAADCVITGLAAWARVNALSELGTMNAQLSAPSRIAGLAFAYAQVRPLLAQSTETVLIEAWLKARAVATMLYFDTDAPKNASRNNLRAWAALAVARIGLTVQDDIMLSWADASVRLVVCDVAADGSLPLEMRRKELALHYQLHSVAPLVITAALLQAAGHDLFMACDRAIHRTVAFVLNAFDDPELAKAISGYDQTYFSGKDDLRGFEMAWASAYLSLFYSPALTGFTEKFGDLGNSKLGGRQSLLWGM